MENHTIPTQLLEAIIQHLAQVKTHDVLQTAGLIQAIQQQCKPVEKEGQKDDTV